MKGVLRIYCETGLFWTVLSKGMAFLGECRNAQCSAKGRLTDLYSNYQTASRSVELLTTACNNAQLCL